MIELFDPWVVGDYLSVVMHGVSRSFFVAALFIVTLVARIAEQVSGVHDGSSGEL